MTNPVGERVVALMAGGDGSGVLGLWARNAYLQPGSRTVQRRHDGDTGMMLNSEEKGAPLLQIDRLGKPVARLTGSPNGGQLDLFDVAGRKPGGS